MEKFYTTPVVDQVSAANIFIDPAVWTKVLINKKSKKPNYVALLILQRILYWYKRTDVVDEKTGRVIGYKKKFKYDMLQLGYKQIQDQIGCSYREAEAAIHVLVETNIIKKELRHFSWSSNVMFVEPIVENILCISNPEGVHKGTHPTPKRGMDPTPKRGTYTLVTSTLTSTKEPIEDIAAVDNSEQLSTSRSSTTNKFSKGNKKPKELQAIKTKLKSKCAGIPPKQPRRQPKDPKTPGVTPLVSLSDIFKSMGFKAPAPKRDG